MLGRWTEKTCDRKSEVVLTNESNFFSEIDITTNPKTEVHTHKHMYGNIYIYTILIKTCRQLVSCTRVMSAHLVTFFNIFSLQVLIS